MQQYGDDTAVGTFIRGNGITRYPSARVGSPPTLVVNLRYAGVPSEQGRATGNARTVNGRSTATEYQAMGSASQSRCGGGGARWQDHDAGSAPALSVDGGGIPFLAAHFRGPRLARPAGNARSTIPRDPAPAKSQIAPMINGRSSFTRH